MNEEQELVTRERDKQEKDVTSVLSAMVEYSVEGTGPPLADLVPRAREIADRILKERSSTGQK